MIHIASQEGSFPLSFRVMEDPLRAVSRAGNPLAANDQESWERILHGLGLPSLIVVARERLGPQLLGKTDPQDVVQEALLLLWKGRHKLEWHGLAAFRALVVKSIENRVNDYAAYSSAMKRSAVEVPIGNGMSSFSGDPGGMDPAVSTTPSRVASASEAARRMGDALEHLPEPTRSVVRLRHFEERSTAEVATALSMSQSQVKHLLRKGLQSYGRQLGLFDHEAG